MNRYQIVLKRTDELNSIEWEEYTLGFNKVFRKSFTQSYFKDKYFSSSFGYSYHGTLLFDSKIVGMFTVIPRQYIYSGQEVTIGLGCDAFILKEHRKDEFFLKEMADVVMAKYVSIGINHFISIPNQTAYPYWIYYGGWKDIGKLNYYVIPLRISKLVGKFEFLDFISFFLFKMLVTVSILFNLLSNKSIDKSIYLKRNKDYIRQRYPSDYMIRELGDKFSFVYRVYKEDNIRTAYLIDCFPQTPRNIAIAVKQIIEETKGEIDIVLFVGKINNPPFFFPKVPKKKEPREQPFIGLSFSEIPDNVFFIFDSWDISLANFDNR